MFTVHTTAPAIALEEYGSPVASGDCFYGWGEPLRGGSCLPHATVDVFDRDDAERVAQVLIRAGHQVVVTDANDWSSVITGATTPIHYRAAHSH